MPEVKVAAGVNMNGLLKKIKKAVTLIWCFALFLKGWNPCYYWPERHDSNMRPLPPQRHDPPCYNLAYSVKTL